MPYYCTVPRCTSMAGKAKNVSFHQFPRDKELARLWNEVLKRGKPYTKYSKVCSLHFKPEDYTLTSAQKNRGQWRTLRKDAIPSQNLPTEVPDDWQRRNTNTFQFPMSIDASVQHQMAQAIYVQTMLAMQAAGVHDGASSLINNEQSSSTSELAQNDDSEAAFPPSLNESQMSLAIPSEKLTYECNQCSKCFKDPDVFILHQRNHIKTDGNTEMLKANPILANLLKNESQSLNKNVVSIENQIMTALTENMANYLRNLSSIMTNGNTSYATDKSDSGDESDDGDNGHGVCTDNLKVDEEEKEAVDNDIDKINDKEIDENIGGASEEVEGEADDRVNSNNEGICSSVREIEDNSGCDIKRLELIVDK